MLEHNASVLDLLHRLFGVPQRRILVNDLCNTSAACLRHGHHDKNHRQEHQTVQNVHAVRQETHQLSRRQTSCNNHVPADPADQKDAAVHNRCHKRVVPGKLQLSLDEHQINIGCRLAESADLVILPDIRLDHTDRGNIFLNALVQIVIALKDLLEIRRGALHDQEQDDSQKHHRRKINTCQSRTDQEGHHKRHDHHRRGAHCHPDQHLECILYVGHICGKTGYQTRRAEPVDVGEGKLLNVVKHRLSQILRKSGARSGAHKGTHNAAEQTEKGYRQHEQAGFLYIRHIACGNSKVYKASHQNRNDHFRYNLTHHKKRCDKRKHLVLPKLPVQRTDYAFFLTDFFSFHLHLSCRNSSDCMFR